MIPLYELEGKPWTTLGFGMSQNRLAIPTWSYGMEKYPPKTIVEIGTNNGGFTCVLGLHAWRIGARIHTYDLCESPSLEFRPLSAILPIEFNQGDCFDPAVKAKIASQIQKPGITYVLCDGGNKPREFIEFSEFIKSGDVIAAHDFCVAGTDWWPWREITVESVQAAIEAHGLKPFFQDYFDQAGWLAFVKS